MIDNFNSQTIPKYVKKLCLVTAFVIYWTFGTTDSIWCSSHCNKWSPFHPSTPSHASSSPPKWSISQCTWMDACTLTILSHDAEVWSALANANQQQKHPCPANPSNFPFILVQTCGESGTLSLSPLQKWWWQEFSRLCGLPYFTSSLLPVFTIQIGCDLAHGRNTR